jgi:hypothetical protein
MAATGKGRDDREAGSSMCITPHAMHRDRHGRTIRRVRRPGPKTARCRPCPQPASRPRSQGRTNPLIQHPLDAPGVVAYGEHRCSFAPARGPPLGFGKRSRGGPPRNRHAHGVLAHHSP